MPYFEDNDDQEVVLAAVTKNWIALVFASERLKGTKEVVLAAVKQSGVALSLASDELKGDQEIVMLAVNENGLMLEHASAELKAVKKVVLAAVKENGLALQYAMNPTNDDDDIVEEAVKEAGNSVLQFASERLRSYDPPKYEKAKPEVPSAVPSEILLGTYKLVSRTPTSEYMEGTTKDKYDARLNVAPLWGKDVEIYAFPPSMNEHDTFPYIMRDFKKVTFNIKIFDPNIRRKVIGDLKNLRTKRGGMRKTKNKRRKQKRKTKRSKRRNNKSNKRKTTRR